MTLTPHPNRTGPNAFSRVKESLSGILFVQRRLAIRDAVETSNDQSEVERSVTSTAEDRLVEAVQPPIERTDFESATPLVEFDNTTRAYRGRRALGPITLRLERGCMGLLGPNGAGKSTMIRLIMGILRPTSGSVRVLGEPAGRDTHRRIGYVPEGDARFPGLTGVQAVIHAGRLVGMERSAAIERAHEVLDYVGLGEARYRDAKTYSTGMRQRLKIAQAIVHDPALLILDEPTEGVDPPAREEILNMLRDLAREHGTSLIVATHLLHEVEQFATHAVILNAGQLLEHGTLRSLRTARSRGHDLRLDGPPNALMAKLRAAGVSHEWRAPVLRVALDDPAAILRTVAEAGLVIRQIAPVEMNLDEVFADAIGRARAPTAIGGTEVQPHA